MEKPLPISQSIYTPWSPCILNVLCNILGGHRGLCSIFGVFGGRPPKLLLHNAQPPGQLGAVGVVVAQQEGGLAVRGDILGDVHGGVVQLKLSGSVG